MITPIERLAPISEVQSAKPVEAVQGDQSLFGAVFQSAIDNVKQTDMEVREAQYLLSTGQLDNPAALTIAAEKESIALDLLIQLRNKALDAYSELTRIWAMAPLAQAPFCPLHPPWNVLSACHPSTAFSSCLSCRCRYILRLCGRFCRRVRAGRARGI